MIYLKESSSKKRFSRTSTQYGVSENEASYNDLLKQVKKVIFKFDLFELLKKDFTTSFGIRKLISQINITACPTDIGEALIDIQHLIDQMCAEFNGDVDAKLKLQTLDLVQAVKFDKALTTYKASEGLMHSRRTTQSEYDTYTTSIKLWESHILDLQKRLMSPKKIKLLSKGWILLRLMTWPKKSKLLCCFPSSV